MFYVIIHKFFHQSTNFPVEPNWLSGVGACVQAGDIQLSFTLLEQLQALHGNRNNKKDQGEEGDIY